MTRLGEILAGWAMAASACAVAAIAFPVISAKAAVQKDAARWNARAQAFEAETVSFKADISPVADRLTDVFMQADFNDVSRDARLLFSNKASTPVVLDWSENQAQTHQCLAEAVYYEARSETKAGQKAVAEVILNRVKSKHYPNTICGVVYQGAERSTGCQFTFTCDGSTAKMPYGKLWTRSEDVARLALTGAMGELTGGATHYHTTDIFPHWAPNMRPTRLIGSHQFYRFRFRERPVATAAVAVAPPI
jgi:spore germination cell wall hydrolase CwlJ-like protein